MRSFTALLLPLAVVVAASGCVKDDIFSSDDSASPASPTENPAVEEVSDDTFNSADFTLEVSVAFAPGGASVSRAGVSGYEDVSADFSVSKSGNHVSITYKGTEPVLYRLSGTASDGSFKLYSEKKQALLLSNLSLTNPSGAAIDNQSGKRTYVILEGVSSLSDGASAAYTTTGDEDQKAVFFSEGQLVFSGSGSLSVKANNSQEKSCIASDDYIRVMEGPVIQLSTSASAGHCLRGKDYVRLSGGTVEIESAAAKKKGISSENYVLVEDGTHTINVSGKVAYDDEDKEYKGSAGIKADNYFAMTGGRVSITNTAGGGKGVQAGSYDYDSKTHAVANSYVSGGTLIIKTSGAETNDESAKGIKIGWSTKSGNRVTGYAGNLNISGGYVEVTCSKAEAIESKGNLTISGGEVYACSASDDAINCQAEMNITGGYVYAYSSGNDAIDANHDMKLSGGYVLAVCTKGSPEVALDANTEEGYKLYINEGATVVAYGGLESGYSAAQSVYSMNCTAGSWNALYDGSGFLAAFKAPSGISSV
ncbi:MAG: carbohydrate-binding domain-containing protein, partial [Bacteroidales bacterium]|nr:carbohydrate-binding domain-containing protein [Bacteroidales bacterium]